MIAFPLQFGSKFLPLKYRLGSCLNSHQPHPHSSITRLDEKIMGFIPENFLCAVIKTPLVFLPPFPLGFVKVLSSTFFPLRNCHHVRSLGLGTAPWKEIEAWAVLTGPALGCLPSQPRSLKQANSYLRQPWPQLRSASRVRDPEQDGCAEPSYPLPQICERN